MELFTINSNLANPHAATTIAGVTYKYDSNGNLASTTARLLLLLHLLVPSYS